MIQKMDKWSCMLMLMAFSCAQKEEGSADVHCTDEEFACEDGLGCIPPSKFCDGRENCKDGSDERLRILPLNSTESGIPCRHDFKICLLPKKQQSKKNTLCTKDVQCTDEEFECKDGSGCIPSKFYCEGFEDCKDGSDEILRILPLKSTESGIPCRQNFKVCLLPKKQQSKKNALCTRDANCTNKESACEDGSGCFSPFGFCNGNQLCKDGSDENLLEEGLFNDNIMCEGTHWNSREPLMCALPKKHQCDGKKFCKSGESDIDECLCVEGDSTSFLDQNCFRCLSQQYKIIPIAQLCDGVFHCSDLSDECLCRNVNSRPEICNLAVFGPVKALNEDVNRSFLCDSANNRISVSQEHICDGRFDCSNKVDESNCRNPDQVKDFPCLDWDRRDFNTTRCDGKPECGVNWAEECGCDEIPGFCRYIYETAEGRWNFRCNANESAVSTRVCDGVADCKDKEDEVYCTNKTHFYCHENTTSFVPAQNVCDQKADCDDESDEHCDESVRCFEKGKNGIGTVYVHRNQICDGNVNCAGGTDECHDFCIQSAFSSSSSLVKNKGVLGCLYTISTVALCGNIMVFLITIRVILCPRRGRGNSSLQKDLREKITITRVLVLSLAIADALVAIYTMAICIQSSITDGKYCLTDQDWRTGSSCSALGALLLIGSEQSVFTMAIITVFRLYTICRPGRPTSIWKLGVVLALTWIISICLGVLPILSHLEDIFTTSIWYTDNKLFSTIEQRDVRNLTYWLLLMHGSSNKSHSDIGSWSTLEKLIGDLKPNFTASRRYGFYSSHTTCIPNFFPDPARSVSWWYSLLLILINFFGFLVIAIGYFLIYRRVTRTSLAIDPSKESDSSSKMQKKLSVIIITDFLCWMPVCIMAFLQLSGVAIPDDLRLVVGMIIIPINSALNPIIYSDLLLVLVNKCKQLFEIIRQRCIEPATRNIRGRFDGDIELNGRSSETEVDQRTRRVIEERNTCDAGAEQVVITEETAV